MGREGGGGAVGNVIKMISVQNKTRRSNDVVNIKKTVCCPKLNTYRKRGLET